MRLGPGDVVWHEAPFEGSGAAGGPPDRPWLVVSNENHPFQGTEYVTLGMTTSERARAIEVTERDWVVGGTRKPSYVSPWYLMTVNHADLRERIGALDEALVGRAVNACTDCLGFEA